MCPYSELFWSVFSHIRTEYGEILSPLPVRMRENMDPNNSEYGHFSRSVAVKDKRRCSSNLNKICINYLQGLNLVIFK